MAKILFLVLLIAAGLIVWRMLGRRSQGHGSAGTSPAAARRIVKCAVCDVHVPEDDAVSYQGKYFCGATHLQDYSRRQTG